MNQSLQSVRVGIFFILGLVLIYAVFSVIGNKDIGEDEGYTVIATFDDIKTLSSGADVRMAGVRIGKVESTGLVEGKGVVTLLIDESVKIPETSSAKIAMASLLGQNYISVEYVGGGSDLAPGATINTQASPDLNAIIGEVQKLGERLNSMADSFSGLGGEDMSKLFANLNGLVTDNRSRVDSLLVNMDEISQKLNQSEGTLGKLINDDTLYNELMLTVTDIQSAARDAKSSLSDAKMIFEKIDKGEGTLGKLLSDDSIAADLEATMDNLRAFSEKLNSGEGTLGKLVTDDTLYIELRGMLNKADQALDTLGDSGPITAVGAVSGALF